MLNILNTLLTHKHSQHTQIELKSVHLKCTLFAFSSIGLSAKYLLKFDFLIFQGSVATFLRWGGKCCMGFVANFIRFPVVQKFWKSVKIWQSYRDFKGGHLFMRHSVVKMTTDHHQNWRGLSCRGSSHAKFKLDRFRGFRAPDDRKSLSPIDLRHHPYNSYALPCYTVILVWRVTYAANIYTLLCMP